MFFKCNLTSFLISKPTNNLKIKKIKIIIIKHFRNAAENYSPFLKQLLAYYGALKQLNVIKDKM